MKFLLSVIFAFSFFNIYAQNDINDDSWSEFDDVITQLQSFLETDELKSLFDQFDDPGANFFSLPMDSFMIDDSFFFNQFLDPNSIDFSQLQELLKGFDHFPGIVPPDSDKLDSRNDKRPLKRI